MGNKLPLKDYQVSAIARGYPFECDCGEIFKTSTAAWGCRKCRKYLASEDFESRSVVDLRTGLKWPSPYLRCL